MSTGDVLPLLTSHNTVQLRFDLEAAEYAHLARTDAAFPSLTYAQLADVQRIEVLPAKLCLTLCGQPAESDWLTRQDLAFVLVMFSLGMHD